MVKSTIGLILAILFAGALKIVSYWICTPQEKIVIDCLLIISTLNGVWYIAYLQYKFIELKQHADILSIAIERLLKQQPIQPGEWTQKNSKGERRRLTQDEVRKMLFKAEREEY